MLKADTVKFCVPLDENILNFDVNHCRFTKNIKVKFDQEIVTYDIDCSGILGINHIRIASNDTAEVQLSAKALGKNYMELIQENTIVQAIEKANDLECFQFIDPLKTLEKAYLHRLDVCLDIPLNAWNVADALMAIETIHNRSYTLSPYPGEGLVIQKNAKTNTCREIFYDKTKEVQRDKELMMLCKPESFKGMLRSELNLRKFTYIRKYLNINHKGNISLVEALQSNEKPNLRYFNEFENPIPSLFSDARQYKNYEDFARAKGEETILKELNYNEAQIFNLIVPFFKDKSSAYKVIRLRIRPLKKKLLQEVKPEANDILNHIKNYLELGHYSHS